MTTFFDSTAAPENAYDEKELRDVLAARRELIERRLNALVPAETTEPTIIHSAMRWSLFAGGKRLRPLLLTLVGETFGAQTAHLLATACAFEMVHTYSLIHDDLPAMDDDDLRRGQPTCHVRYGEAMAILAGDALQALAFRSIAEDAQLAPDVRLALVAELARAAGTPDGMVAGQVADICAESRLISGAELETIHRRKTGALINAAARCGALIARAGADEIASITRYAAGLGLLFQITDDLLDVTATASDLGKTPGKDERAQKATYPAIYGLEAAHKRAQLVAAQADAALDELPHETKLLRAVTRLILNRRA